VPNKPLLPIDEQRAAVLAGWPEEYNFGNQVKRFKRIREMVSGSVVLLRAPALERIYPATHEALYVIGCAAEIEAGSAGPEFSRGIAQQRLREVPLHWHAHLPLAESFFRALRRDRIPPEVRQKFQAVDIVPDIRLRNEFLSFIVGEDDDTLGITRRHNLNFPDRRAVIAGRLLTDLVFDHEEEYDETIHPGLFSFEHLTPTGDEPFMGFAARPYEKRSAQKMLELRKDVFDVLQSPMPSSMGTVEAPQTPPPPPIPKGLQILRDMIENRTGPMS
jgi:hypothetical protein